MFSLIARRSSAARRFAAFAAARPANAKVAVVVVVPDRHSPATTTRAAAFFSDYPSPPSPPGGGDSKSRGVVKWFDAKKGFGFIMPDDGSADLFVHHSSIHASGFRSLGDGESVEFDVVSEPNGKTKAINVTGPDGGYVRGSPRRISMDDSGYGGGGYGYGGNMGGGGGGYGRNDGGYGRGGGY